MLLRRKRGSAKIRGLFAALLLVMLAPRFSSSETVQIEQSSGVYMPPILTNGAIRAGGAVSSGGQVITDVVANDTPRPKATRSSAKASFRRLLRGPLITLGMPSFFTTKLLQLPVRLTRLRRLLPLENSLSGATGLLWRSSTPRRRAGTERLPTKETPPRNTISGP